MIEQKRIYFTGLLLAFCMALICNVGFVYAASIESVQAMGNAILRKDGTLWVSGDYTLNDTEYRWEEPHLLDTNVSKIVSANYAIFYIKKNGDLVGWGEDGPGFGDDSEKDKESPVVIVKDVVDACYCCAVKSDGTLWMWGGVYDWTSNGSKPHKMGVKDIAKVRPYAYITKTGDLYMWGDFEGESTHVVYSSGYKYFSSTPVFVMSNVEDVSVARSHRAILTKSGEVWTIGTNQWGQLGVSLEDRTLSDGFVLHKVMTGVSAVSVEGPYYTAALKNDGTLWTWGLVWGKPPSEMHGGGWRFVNGNPNPAPESTNIAAIADGGRTIVKQDGTVWEYREYEDGKGFYQIIPGEIHTPTIKTCQSNHPGSVVVQWDEVELAKNYEVTVRIPNNSDEVKKKTISKSNNALLICSFDGLKRGERYIVEVRALSPNQYYADSIRAWKNVTIHNGLLVSDFWNFCNFSSKIKRSVFERYYGPERAIQLAKDPIINGSSGLCFGMALGALSTLQEGMPSLVSYGKKSLHDVSKGTKSAATEISAEEFIKNAFAYQQVSLKRTIIERNFGEISGLINSVSRAEEDNTGIIVYVQKINGEGIYEESHFVVALGIKNADSEKLELRIYDPNYPNIERTMTCNRINGRYSTWSYAGYKGNAGEKSYVRGETNDIISFLDTSFVGTFSKAFSATENSNYEYLLLSFASEKADFNFDYYLDKDISNGYIQRLITGAELESQNGKIAQYICESNSFSCSSLPAGVTVTASLANHSVTVRVEEEADIYLSVDDDDWEDSCVRVTPVSKNTSYTVEFSFTANNTSLTEKKVFTGYAKKGKTAQIEEKEDSVWIMGSTSIKAQINEGNTDEEGKFGISSSQTVSATGLSEEKTYQVKGTLEKVEIRTSQSGKPVYTFDEIVATSADTTKKEKTTFTVGTNTYKVTKSKSTVAFKQAKSSAKTVTIPATVTYNGIKYKVTSISKNALKKNKKVTKVTIGSNVTSIGSSAFQSCTKLKTVKIGEKVKTIGASAFSGDSALTSLTMGSAVTTIGDKAFYKCTALTKITIPAKVTKIGKSAFQGCKKLKAITIKSTKLTAKKVGAKAFTGTAASATVKVPKKSLKAYKKWLTQKGLSKKAAIAAAENSGKTVEIPAGAMKYNGHSYFLYSFERLTWLDAERYCEKRGGHLVTITSQKEQDAVYNYISPLTGTADEDDPWIGISDYEQEGKWTYWVTGEKAVYSNWAEGMPDNYDKGQDFGLITTGNRGFGIMAGQWDDNAEGKRNFICEWDE